MHGLFAGLTTLDLAHRVGEVPDPATKTTSLDHFIAAGGPATNAAVTFATLCRLLPDPDGGGSAGLLTAVGRGPLADVVLADLAGAGVDVLDATAGSAGVPGSANDLADPVGDSLRRIGEVEPALSGIVEHPGGRMVTSTNARLPLDVPHARDLLVRELGSWQRAGHEGPDVVLVDGHNPELAALALHVGVGSSAGVRSSAGVGSGTGTGADPGTSDGVPEDPFAELEDRPSHLRLLDGGSWKPWFTPLLGLVDVAVVSADFRPPVLTASDGDATAAFLRGFGITKVVRTDGANPVRWWWDGDEGEVAVEEVPEASTLGAGDVFHGALAWALARTRAAGVAVPGDPTHLLTFACAVASCSTRTFGTRAWREDPRLDVLVRGFQADPGLPTSPRPPRSRRP